MTIFADVADLICVIDQCHRLEGLEGHFDIIFMDADKHNNSLYVNRILDQRLLSPHGVIFVDNGKQSNPPPDLFIASIHLSTGIVFFEIQSLLVALP